MEFILGLVSGSVVTAVVFLVKIKTVQSDKDLLEAKYVKLEQSIAAKVAQVRAKASEIRKAL